MVRRSRVNIDTRSVGMTTYAEYVETTHMFDYETMSEDEWIALQSADNAGMVLFRDSEGNTYYERAFVLDSRTWHSPPF